MYRIYYDKWKVEEENDEKKSHLTLFLAQHRHSLSLDRKNV